MSQPPDHTSNGDLQDWEALDGVIEELPPGVPILPPEHATDFSRYRRLPRSLWTKDEAWQGCVEVIEKYDAEMCKAYREEIDTLLVFAGLFSAVVTGFTVEAYQWLQEDSNDAILTVLSQIASSVGPNTSVAAAPSSSGMARSVSIRINAYWFLALCLSLATALVAILGKQWVREYERHAAMRPQEYIGVRQTKLEGFQFWKVGDIISALPLLLQLSLALFVLGLIELLWQLDPALGIVVCIPAVLALLFYLSTTLLPVLQFSWPSRASGTRLRPCAFKSSQALLAMYTYHVLLKGWRSLAVRLRSAWSRLSLWLCISRMNPELHDEDVACKVDKRSWRSWSHWDKESAELYVCDYDQPPSPEPSSISRGLRWLVDTVDEKKVKELVFNCILHLADERTHITPTGTYDISPWLRRDVWHPFYRNPLDVVEYAGALPRSCAVLTVFGACLNPIFTSEILLQHLQLETHPAAVAYFILRFGSYKFLDPEVGPPLVRLIASYCRRHIREDISEVLYWMWFLMENPALKAVRLALRRCTVVSMINWMRLWNFPSARGECSSFHYAWCAMYEILKDLAQGPEEYDRYPERLHRMPHVEEFAALAKAYFIMCNQPVSWPLPETFDYHIIQDVCSGDSDRMILELVKISILGIDRSAVTQSSQGEMEPRNDDSLSESIPHPTPTGEAAPFTAASGRHTPSLESDMSGSPRFQEAPTPTAASDDANAPMNRDLDAFSPFSDASATSGSGWIGSGDASPECQGHLLAGDDRLSCVVTVIEEDTGGNGCDSGHARRDPRSLVAQQRTPPVAYV